MRAKLIHRNTHAYDLDATLAFYEKALGLTEKRRKLPHGYQYNMELPQAFRNFELCTSFLREHM